MIRAIIAALASSNLAPIAILRFLQGIANLYQSLGLIVLAR